VEDIPQDIENDFDRAKYDVEVSSGPSEPEIPLTDCLKTGHSGRCGGMGWSKSRRRGAL